MRGSHRCELGLPIDRPLHTRLAWGVEYIAHTLGRDFTKVCLLVLRELLPLLEGLVWEKVSGDLGVVPAGNRCIEELTCYWLPS